MAIRLDIDNQRRDEPAPDEPHYHVWIDTGKFAIIAQPPRFRSRQAARQAAIRNGYRPDVIHVMKCKLPCRFEKTHRKRRKTS